MTQPIMTNLADNYKIVFLHRFWYISLSENFDSDLM